MSMFQQLLKQSIGMEAYEEMSAEELIHDIRVSIEDIDKAEAVLTHITDLTRMLDSQPKMSLESAVFIESATNNLVTLVGTISNESFRNDIMVALEEAGEAEDTRSLSQKFKDMSRRVSDKIKRGVMKVKRLANILGKDIRPLYNGLKSLTKEEYASAIEKLKDSDFKVIAPYIARDGRPAYLREFMMWCNSNSNKIYKELVSSWKSKDPRKFQKILERLSAIKPFEFGNIQYSISVQGTTVKLHKEVIRSQKEGKFDLTQKDLYEVMDVGAVVNWVTRLSAEVANSEDSKEEEAELMAKWEKEGGKGNEYVRMAVKTKISMNKLTSDLLLEASSVMEKWKNFSRKVLKAAGKEVPEASKE